MLQTWKHSCTDVDVFTFQLFCVCLRGYFCGQQDRLPLLSHLRIRSLDLAGMATSSAQNLQQAAVTFTAPADTGTISCTSVPDDTKVAVRSPVCSGGINTDPLASDGTVSSQAPPKMDGQPAQTEWTSPESSSVPDAVAAVRLAPQQESDTAPGQDQPSFALPTTPRFQVPANNDGEEQSAVVIQD